MTIRFTEDELKWIQKKLFHWEVKDECPKKIKKNLQDKINQFYNGEHYGEKHD